MTVTKNFQEKGKNRKVKNDEKEERADHEREKEKMAETEQWLCCRRRRKKDKG